MPQSKSAEATIRGFLFQFQETVIQLFDSDEKIIVEGLDQDIELEKLHIQCKYYKKWTNSDLSKTIKPIYKYFLENKNKNLKYQLNLHVSEVDKSKDFKELKNLKSILKMGGLKDTLVFSEIDLKESNLKDFNKKLEIFQSGSIDKSKNLIAEKLANSIGIKNGEFLYSAVIGEILEISSQDSVNERTISQEQFLGWLGESTKILAMEWFLARREISKYNKQAIKIVKDYLHTRTIFLFNILDIKNSEEIINIVNLTKKLKRGVFPVVSFSLTENHVLISDAKNKLFDQEKVIIDEYPFSGSLSRLSRFKNLENEKKIKFIEQKNIENLCESDSGYAVIHFYTNKNPSKIDNANQNHYIPIESLSHLLTILN